jgi:hypothetical protein
MRPSGGRSCPTSERPGLSRRALLAGLGAAAAALAAPRGVRAEAGSGVYLVPGYRPDMAYFEGRPLLGHPAFTANIPRGYDGPTTLVTRIDGATGAVARAVMPIGGHAITVRPGGGAAIFNSLNGGNFIAFDPVSLEIDRDLRHDAGFIGAGHAAYGRDGVLVTIERRALQPFTGRIADHYGRLVLRDADSLAPLQAYACHGLAPHEVELTADGRYAVIANYGEAGWPDGGAHDGLPFLVEPSLTVIELAGGKLVHKVVNDDARTEVRHVAVRGLDRVFAIQARLARFADGQVAMADWDGVYEPDLWSAGPELGYLPAPVRRYDLAGASPAGTESITDRPALMRYGQSIVYDPVHDQAIASFPTRHAVVVFDGRDGAVRRVIDTERFGLRQPRGVALHPDGRRYAVSGYWNDIALLARGSHRLDRGGTIRATFFGHSHMTLS